MYEKEKSKDNRKEVFIGIRIWASETGKGQVTGKGLLETVEYMIQTYNPVSESVKGIDL